MVLLHAREYFYIRPVLRKREFFSAPALFCGPFAKSIAMQVFVRSDEILIRFSGRWKSYVLPDNSVNYSNFKYGNVHEDLFCIYDFPDNVQIGLSVRRIIPDRNGESINETKNFPQTKFIVCDLLIDRFVCLTD